MTLPALADSDPDPSSQIAWPRKHRALDARQVPVARVLDPEDPAAPPPPPYNGKSTAQPEPGKQRLSTWNLFTLSIAMAGSQIAWTVELGYGTPFLLSLGLSEQLTSLVWLAGPISGLIAQPVIGAISDSSSSKYRRRYWIVTSTVVLVLSTLLLAFCQDIAAVLVDFVGGGLGDWDPKRIKQVSHTAIGLAIVAFYLLDFALNALQASLRNLLLDITPHGQLNAGNAWHGRMTHAGNIVGFGFGFLPLANLPVLRWLGGDQFRKFCIVAMAILVVTVWITCWCHEELARTKVRRSHDSKFLSMVHNIRTSILTLPKPIRRVCYVQVFAFMGWFPFLFYATTYVGQVMAYQHNEEPDKDLATRKGEFAMLVFSIVAVCCGIILPHLAARDGRLFVEHDPEEDAEISRIRRLIRQWRAEAARQSRPLRLPVMPFLLRNIWTAALVLFTILTFSTFFVSTVVQATIVLGLVGICWAVAIWVPFAIVMEFLKELEEPQADTSPSASRPNGPPRTRSSPTVADCGNGEGSNERQPLLRRSSHDEFDADIGGDAIAEPVPIAGGTVLGIHNLAIVFPQLIVAVVASVIFRIVDAETESDPSHHNTYLGKNGVAWVLRFGGFCTLIGAVITRGVPPTRTEKRMRQMLSELRDINESGGAP